MGITILGGINQGLIWALLAIGVFVTFRILDFADLTVEGSFALGGLIAALFINNLSLNPFLATFVAMLAGGVAGLVTGLLNVKLKIPPILSGILTMTALVSINLLVTGGTPSIPVLYAPTVYNWIFPEGMKIFNISANYFSELIMGIIFVAAVVAILYWFFGTEVGMSIRATGANEKMSRAQGINTDLNKIYALVISNALVGLSGALFAQQQAGATNTMGQGAIVIGLAAVVIGETLIHHLPHHHVHHLLSGAFHQLHPAHLRARRGDRPFRPHGKDGDLALHQAQEERCSSSRRRVNARIADGAGGRSVPRRGRHGGGTKCLNWKTSPRSSIPARPTKSSPSTS